MQPPDPLQTASDFDDRDSRHAALPNIVTSKVLRLARRFRVLLLATLTLGLGGLIYHGVGGFEFLNFDDPIYLSGNPWLAHGLTWASTRWAFTANLSGPSAFAEYWSPITLLSRLLDAQLFGLDAGRFHLSSAAIHILNSLLLASALYQLTGEWRRSALVSLLFLIHPQNMEPVCWLSARKDLLSATFFFCTLLAYAHYARRPGAVRYLLLLLAFSCALMSKPMGVSIPFVLLLLDWWPLQRWRGAKHNTMGLLKLAAEKVALLLLAAGAAYLAVVSQRNAHAIQPPDWLPIAVRIQNAIVSYATYTRRVFVPDDLCIYYPHPGAAGLPLGKVLLAAVSLFAITAVALLRVRKSPYQLAGWIWFVATLGPVIGLVQIGNQSMADRYAYPSAIGLSIAVVWTFADWLAKRRLLAFSFAMGSVTGLVLCSLVQVQTWRNSITVFTRAVHVTDRNGLAWLNLGTGYLAKERWTQARACYFKALEIMPTVPAIWLDLGTVESALGRDSAALEDYAMGIRLAPDYAKCSLGIARILQKRGDQSAATAWLEHTIDLDPSLAEPYYTLGAMSASKGEWEQTEAIWTRYLARYPSDDAARRNLQHAREKRAAPGR